MIQFIALAVAIAYGALVFPLYETLNTKAYKSAIAQMAFIAILFEIVARRRSYPEPAPKGIALIILRGKVAHLRSVVYRRRHRFFKAVHWYYENPPVRRRSPP
ncbi:hypothetical protein [Nostoc sp.]